MELPDIITIIGRTISQPFLFLTFFYYWHSIQFNYSYKMCFMNYLASLMISNFWNIWAISNEYHKERPTHIFHIYNCIELLLLLWTNVLCFNFWQNIKNFIPPSSNGSERTTYIKCLIYVWTCSLLYTIVGFINDYLFIPQSQIYRAITWISFTFPVMILLSNVFMIVHATIIIIKEMKTIIKNLNELDNDKRKKKLLILYGKLVVVTILLLCSKWFWFRLNNILQIRTFYLIFERLMVANSFQGVLIFLLFALKKKRIIELKIKISDLFSEQTTNCELITPETPSNREHQFDVINTFVS